MRVLGPALLPSDKYASPAILIRLLILLAMGLFLAPRGSAQGQSGPPASGLTGQDVGVVVVSVREASGGTVENLVTVHLYTQRQQLYSSATMNAGSIRFEGVPLGTYIVEATSPGYASAREEIELMLGNDQRQVLLSLRAASDSSGKPVAPGPPLLVPKIQKELARGLEELRANHLDEARKHLSSAARLAPLHPDVNYLLGLLATKSGDPVGARKSFEKAISEYPNHAHALLALGEQLLQQGDLSGAKTYLDRAVAAAPSMWRSYLMLAHLFLRVGDFGEAQRNAERALELGKSDANSARLVLAKALVGQEKKDQAVLTLQAFLDAKPIDSESTAARRLLDGLSKTALSSSQAGSVEIVAASDPAPLPSPLPAPAGWLPPSVDDAIPPVEAGVACDLSTVLSRVGKRVVEFTRAVDHFTATEHFEHQILDAQGIAKLSESRKFNYLVSIQEVRPGYINVDEYRNGSTGYEMFPGGIATVGLSSIVLMFHPVNVNDYEFSCEGLGTWQGTHAWQLYFHHKDAARSPIRTYRISGRIYPVPLKGRAWIAAGSSQVLRIETDLRAPLPEIKLLAEHLALDYGPVRFKSRNVQLWLPAVSDIYFDFRGVRIHRRHSFTDFLLFSIEDKQKIESPRELTAPADSYR